MTNRDISAHKVARVPELLSIICKHLGRSQCASVVSVSRRFFNAAMPIIWREVEGVHNLLVLLPLTRVVEDLAIPSAHTGAFTIVKLSDYLSLMTP